ncbi:MAG TPA: multicopper oxidase domain-containing protein [Tepidisphaeraceae bacterium]|nr:multicopper oxidase domain-containing protein [Tepidisphaeraceae bacterium]
MRSRQRLLIQIIILLPAIAIFLLLVGFRSTGGEPPIKSPAQPAGTFPNSEAPTFNDILHSLPPKSTLGVVKGEKTIAPQVPAPITRLQNKIVEYDLTVRETSAKIAPNLTYQSLWAFDGVVPGPVMRVKVGDVLRLTLHNSDKNVTGHNIDLHFIDGACGGCADTCVKPGQTRTIEARALYPGIFMYHCAYHQQGNILAVHIANGMYGFLIVDPQIPLPKVDHEFMLIEGEFYVQRAGRNIGSLSYKDLVDEKPTYVFFNGKHADLTPPLTIRTNQRIRLYVGRGGVNGTCAFHVIGTIFDKVYPGGGTLNSPIERGIQTVNVPPGGGTIVEFVSPVPGTLIAVDHNLSRVCFKGLGQTFNVIGPPNPEIYESIGSDQSSQSASTKEAKAH